MILSLEMRLYIFPLFYLYLSLVVNILDNKWTRSANFVTSSLPSPIQPQPPPWYNAAEEEHEPKRQEACLPLSQQTVSAAATAVSQRRRRCAANNKSLRRRWCHSLHRRLRRWPSLHYYSQNSKRSRRRLR